jgi:hypothetical protein
VVPAFPCALRPLRPHRKSEGRKSERIWNADRRSIQPAVLLARPRLQQEAHAYRRSTAALTCGLSPAERDFRPGFLGRGENADLSRSPFRRQHRTQLMRALPAPACPSPVAAPHRPVLVPVYMMPEVARERFAISARGHRPRPRAAICLRDRSFHVSEIRRIMVTEKGTIVNGRVTRSRERDFSPASTVGQLAC